ncbi:MAG TPA: hypothetical protein VF789_04185 [Thermoanaerobaculia bacterium]
MDNPQNVVSEGASFTGMIRLKAERVEEKATVSEEGGAKVSFLLELTADHSQPLTIELAEPRVTLILHGVPVEAGLAA